MTERSIRNLANLPGSASTTRVLNLTKVHADHGHTREWGAAPLFLSPVLNRAIILKHRLRRDEVDRFRIRRHVATKIVLAIDSDDLRAGGRSVFINEIGFEESLKQAFGVGARHPDQHTLAVIDALPSFDPFLLREQLRRNGITPAPCYFDLSPADLRAMVDFVSEEIAPLVELSLDADFDLVVENPLAILTHKILSNSAEEDLSALGVTLMLPPEQYEEGVFCWKGFLYYKWTLRSVLAKVGAVIEAVRLAKPLGHTTWQQYAALDRARAVVRRRILTSCEGAADMMRVYDDAFRELTQEGRPTAFRAFLRDSPVLFSNLGERLGTLQHIVSFWNYRISPHMAPPTSEELIDLLADFETTLGGGDDEDDDHTRHLAA
ncbi:MAG: hypothetical protein ACXW3O_08875 [Brevundimonas sp.]